MGGIRANLTFPAEYLLENLKIQNNVIEASWRSGVRRLLFIGSSCIYPKFSKQPIREEELLSGYLESSLEPYALAKISGIKLCEALRKQYGFDAISIMPWLTGWFPGVEPQGDDSESMVHYQDGSYVIPNRWNDAYR